jgi:hypothetical protein
MKVSGLDPGLPVEFIEYNDPEVTSSAFEFMLETESPLPEPREVRMPVVVTDPAFDGATHKASVTRLLR